MSGAASRRCPATSARFTIPLLSVMLRANLNTPNACVRPKHAVSTPRLSGDCQAFLKVVHLGCKIWLCLFGTARQYGSFQDKAETKKFEEAGLILLMF